MDRVRSLGWLPLLLVLGCEPAAAEDMALTRDAEAGFRRLRHLAETGGLGGDVSGANVGIARTHARVELLSSPDASPRVLLLTRKGSEVTASRWFAVAAGAGATPADVERVARALDQIFAADPFVVMNAEESSADAPLPGIAEAWSYGGWEGVLHALERRMRARAGTPYAAATIVALALGLSASVVLLWASAPDD